MRNSNIVTEDGEVLENFELDDDNNDRQKYSGKQRNDINKTSEESE